MADESYDTDAKNYSLPELIEALGLKGTPSKQEVTQAVDQQRRTYSKDRDMVDFFEDAGKIVKEALSQKTNDRPVVSRVVNIDSFYRESLTDTTDSFTCTLSETLTGVTAISLLSIEIPQTWYSFSAAKGTNAFLFQTIDADDTTFTKEVVIQEGNYSNLSLLATVQNALNATVEATLWYPQLVSGPWFTLTQDPIDGISTLQLAATFPKTVKLTWYDNTYAALAATKLNCSLGWELGFRYPSTALAPGTSVRTNALVSAASSTKYLVLKLDDHTSSRLASNVVTVRTIPDQQITLPSYSSSAVISRNGVQSVIALPTAPRRLTNAQLLTVTNIASNAPAQRLRAEGGDTTNIFAKIPIKHQTDWANYTNGQSNMKEDGPGKLIVEMGGTLQKNKRIYFGPVTLYKLSVSIYDDHGNLLGLNNQNWSFTLEAVFG